jgi:hypothetical protein
VVGSSAEHKKQSESAILAQCLEWLAIKRIFAWRNNTGSFRTPDGRFIRYGHVGSSDILGIIPFDGVGWSRGAILAVECKTRDGRQSKPQKVFEDMVNKSGGVYLIARNTADLERTLVPLP